MTGVDNVTDVVTILTRHGATVALGMIDDDHVEELQALFADIVERGDGYPHLPPLTQSVFEDTWIRPVTVVVAAVIDGNLAGAYYLKPNGPGLAAHIANAGYLVARERRGEGIGRALVADSVERAPLAGFDAVQFNFVFASNPARRMYEELGWTQVGRIPDAVARPTPASTPEDAIVYWRRVGT